MPPGWASTFLRFDNESRPRVAIAESGEDFPLSVTVRDTLTFGRELEVPADLVVLGVGMEPRDVADIIEMTKTPVGDDGFLLEVHPKLRPVETAIPGVYLAGAAQGPRDITESTSSASAASVKAATMLARDFVEMEPFVARVDLSRCSGVGACARRLPVRRSHQPDGRRSRGGCHREACLRQPGGLRRLRCLRRRLPRGAIDVQGWEMEQYRAMIEAITSAPPVAVAAA